MRTSARCRSGSRAPARAGSHRRVRAAARAGRSRRSAGRDEDLGERPLDETLDGRQTRVRLRCAASSRERSRRLRTMQSSARIDQAARTSDWRCSAPSSEPWILQPLERRLDGCQRRVQVMADRAQERRLQRVAAAQRLGLERLVGEPFPVEREPGDRGQRRHEAALTLEVSPRVRQVKRPEHAVAGAKLERPRVVLPVQRLRSPIRLELDAGPGNPEGSSDRVADPAQLGLGVRSSQQCRRELSEAPARARAAPPRGRGASPAPPGRWRAAL